MNGTDPAPPRTAPGPASARSSAAASRPAPRRRRSGYSVSGWLLPPLFLGVVAFAVWIVLAGPTGLFGWVVGGLVVIALGWVLVSSLFPASADRTCPACGKDTLVRVDPDTTRGLTCKSCLWKDEATSSFFLAEEEGAIEPTRLRERQKRRRSPDEGARVRIRSWTGPDPLTRRTDVEPPPREGGGDDTSPSA